MSALPVAQKIARLQARHIELQGATAWDRRHMDRIGREMERIEAKLIKLGLPAEKVGQLEEVA